MKERSTQESYQQQRLTWRTKGGLETPLIGRFYGENKRLIFAPPLWYDALVILCVFGGLFFLLVSFGIVRMGIFSDYEEALTFGSIGFMLAGVWAALSNERMVCDLRTRTYARLEGQGWRKRLTRGSLSELHAMVLMTEDRPLPMVGGRPVAYRLVLYWKNAKEPLLVVGRDDRIVPPGVPINAAAGPIAHFGQRCAHALGVTFYDNSFTSSAGPLPVV